MKTPSFVDPGTFLETSELRLGSRQRNHSGVSIPGVTRIHGRPGGSRLGSTGPAAHLRQKYGRCAHTHIAHTHTHIYIYT